MSPFKSYGKVNELDQMMLEAKRKTRKRITIIGLSSIIFIGVVIGAVFGVVNNNSKNDHDNNASQNSLTNSMKAVCDVTLYKDSCYESLGSVVNSGKDVQPEELFKLSINVALTHVSKVIEYFNDHGVFKNLIGNNDSKNKEALKNCRDLLDLAVDHLNNSLTTSGENSSLFQVFDDLQTWLSAAGTILSH
jgi:pectinesterase